MTIGYVFKAQYYLPWNASQIYPPFVVSSEFRERKTKREILDAYSTSRWSIYRFLEQILDGYDFDGRACILRSICEAADAQFTHHTGLLGEIFHVLFTPSTSHGEKLSRHRDNEYLKAEFLGKEEQFSCQRQFPECKKSFLELFSGIFHKKKLVTNF